MHKWGLTLTFDTGQEGPLVAEYAIITLAKMLYGFAVDFKETYGYTEEEIQTCREWMSNQKEWQFK